MTAAPDSAAGAPRRRSREDRVARLARLGFGSVDRAAVLLYGGDLALCGPPVGQHEPDSAALVDSLAAAADPDLAVLALHRLAERAPDRVALLARLGESPAFRARLIGVLGASAPLGEHLIARPSDWSLLDDDLLSVARPTARRLVEKMLTSVGATVPPTGGHAGAATRVGAPGMQALRLAYNRAVLLLAARDLAGDLAVEDAAGELSDLAAATVTAALAIATAELPPTATPCRLAVIGMGKCGGRELNYVSDVDVIFVAEPVPVDGTADRSTGYPSTGYSSIGDPAGGPATGTDSDAALRTAARLASRTVQICGQVAWPLDAALRPEGAQGPLVRSLRSHENYYRRWARTWEFQALLKARPIAGDAELGRAYLERIGPIVWSAAQRDHFVDDVRAMRQRVVDTLPAGVADRELKLGVGGLRDIEFAVQLLQLVHGRADESLRSGATLSALAALGAGGYVGRDDAATLAAAYRFLRRTEHLLQLRQLRRTHTVPDDPAALRWLGRALGLPGARSGDPVEAFAAERARHAREVRRLHEKLFYRPLLAAVARVPTDAMHLQRAAAGDRLAALGFTDPAGALRHLDALTAGVSRRAAIQRTLLPALLDLLASAPDPDAGLLSYRRVSEALEGTPWYLRLLRDEGAVTQRLAHLLGSGRYVSDLLARAPEALRLLADDSELAAPDPDRVRAAIRSIASRRTDPQAAVDAVRAHRRHEQLRTASADLLGRLDVHAVGQALSTADAAAIDAALDVAIRSVCPDRPPRLAVIGMGSLGGGETGYASDADVLWVFEAADGDDAAVAGPANRIAELTTGLLRRAAPDPRLVLDAGLRPEGRDGPVARSLAAYAAYYRRWSQPWESQALLRARPVAGDEGLGRRFIDLIDGLRYPPGGLTNRAIVHIRRLKARVDAERLPRAADPATHTKLGRGGLADVEWTVQLLQLGHAGRLPALRTTSTYGALIGCGAAGLLDGADSDDLVTAWIMATRARNAVVLVRGRPGDQLPTTATDRRGVARALGYPVATDPDEFVDDYLRATRRARSAVDRIFYGAS